MATTRMEYDDSRARTELGYSSMPAREALARAVRWYVDHGFVKDCAGPAHSARGQARPGDRSARRRRPDASERREAIMSAVRRPGVARRAGREAFALHERYLNPQMPRVLRTIGFDRDYVRGRGRVPLRRGGERTSTSSPGSACSPLGRCHPGDRAGAPAMRSDARRCRTSCRWNASRSSGLLAEALVARMPERRVPMLLHEQRRRVGRDVLKFVALRDRSRAGPVRRSRVPRPDDRRVVAERRARVPRPLRRSAPRLPSVPFGDLDALERELEPATSPRSSSSRSRARACSSRPTAISRAAAELCHRHGALLAVDEVQTGLGRTGTFFAFEQWDVEPDLVTVAKALSGGYVPVGAVIAKRAVSRRCSTRWTAPSCTARRSARTCSR